MKKKMLIIQLGMAQVENIIPAVMVSEYFEFIYLVDEINRKERYEGDDLYYIDFSNEKKMSDLLYEISPFDHILIAPSLMSLKGNSDRSSWLSELLRKVFLSTKMLYRPVMRSRFCKMWYLDFSPMVSETIGDEEGLLNVFYSGLNAISRVAAMELAKKKVTVNTVKISEKQWFHEVFSLMTWSTDKGLYMTAQELSIKRR